MCVGDWLSVGVCNLLFVKCRSLRLVGKSLLMVVCRCALRVDVWCLLVVVGCLSVTCYLLRAVCCVLTIGCFVPCVVCCLVFVMCRVV